jgi:short-subunit dehydrogenase
VAGELREAGGTAIGLALDVADDGSVEAARATLEAEFGPVDILINNAGIVYGGAFQDVPLARHRAMLAVNYSGLIAVTHAFLPALLSRPSPAIVQIASASALVPLPWGATYAASKAAVLSFAESLREELRLTGHGHVHVMAVCPSFIDTGMFAGVKPPRGSRMLTADGMAAAVVRGLERRSKLLIEPPSVRWLWSLLRGAPRPVFHWFCARLGVSTCMAGWQGRMPERD